MSLRFAIIKHIKTLVGQNWEDVVFEYQEEKVYNSLLGNLLEALPPKPPPPPPRKWYQRKVVIVNEGHLDEAAIRSAFVKAWTKTVSDFKEVTITIF